jgi:hypothetical protein
LVCWQGYVNSFLKMVFWSNVISNKGGYRWQRDVFESIFVRIRFGKQESAGLMFWKARKVIEMKMSKSAAMNHAGRKDSVKNSELHSSKKCRKL